MVKIGFTPTIKLLLFLLQHIPVLIVDTIPLITCQHWVARIAVFKILKNGIASRHYYFTKIIVAVWLIQSGQLQITLTDPELGPKILSRIRQNSVLFFCKFLDLCEVGMIQIRVSKVLERIRIRIRLNQISNIICCTLF